MKTKFFRITANDEDWALMEQAAGDKVSLAAYFRFCGMTAALRIAKERAALPDLVAREREAVYNFVASGCASVEDVTRYCRSLTATEIEAHLFALEQLNRLESDRQKKGRTTLWFIPAGLDGHSKISKPKKKA